MKLPPKTPKRRKNYFLPDTLTNHLEKLASKLGYTETELVVIALERLMKDNE